MLSAEEHADSYRATSDIQSKKKHVKCTIMFGNASSLKTAIYFSRELWLGELVVSRVRGFVEA